MLEFIREKRRSKFVILILGVIILVFVFWGMTPQGDGVNNPAVAIVDGVEIPADVYARSFQAQARQIPKELIEAMNLRQEVADMLVNRLLVLTAAKRDGIKVSKQEVQDNILADPTFHDDGAFDFDFYIGLLNSNRIKEEDYEANIRDEIRIQKMTAKVTAGVTVIETEARELFEREERQVALDYVQIEAKDFEASVKATDLDITKYYELNKQAFMRPTEVKAVYAYIDKAELAKTVSVAGEDVKAFYEKNIVRYQKPIEFKASHILVKPDAANSDQVKADEDARTKAEGLLEELKGGADFAAMAKEHSEDTGSGAKGGDLGYFSLGRMVKPFEAAVIELQVGETSELVQTRFGYHIIKLIDRLDDRTTPLEEVREDIEEILKRNEADAEARARMNSLLVVFESTDDMTKLREEAESRGGVVKETELFAEDDTEVELAASARLRDVAFVLNAGVVANSIVESRGKLYIIKVTERVDAHVPTLDKVDVLVKEVFTEERSKELADAAGKEIITELKEGKKLSAIIKARSLKKGKTEYFKGSDGVIPELNVYLSGMNDIFTLTDDAPVYKETVPYNDGVYVFILRDAKEADAAGFVAVREELKRRIFDEKKAELLEGWIGELRANADITYNEEYM